MCLSLHRAGRLRHLLRARKTCLQGQCSARRAWRVQVEGLCGLWAVRSVLPLFLDTGWGG